jgi:hypothetical protein
VDSTADSFFGDSDSLGSAMDGAFAGAAAPAAAAPASAAAGGGGSFVTAPMSARGTMPDDSMLTVPAGMPSSRLGWWLVPVVVVVAILAGVLIAWLM